MVYFYSSSDLLALLKCVCGSACMERGQDWRRRPLIRLMRPCDILRSTSAAANAMQSLFLPRKASKHKGGRVPRYSDMFTSNILRVKT